MGRFLISRRQRLHVTLATSNPPPPPPPRPQFPCLVCGGDSRVVVGWVDDRSVPSGGHPAVTSAVQQPNSQHGGTEHYTLRSAFLYQFRRGKYGQNTFAERGTKDAIRRGLVDSWKLRRSPTLICTMTNRDCTPAYEIFYKGRRHQYSTVERPLGR